MSSKSNVLPFALLAGAGLWFIATRQARAGTVVGGTPGPGRAFFASPAVASGVQSGQNLASALGSLVNRAFGGTSTPSTGTPASSSSGPSTGDFSRMDRASYDPTDDGLSVNPPYGGDTSGMPADLADFWG